MKSLFSNKKADSTVVGIILLTLMLSLLFVLTQSEVFNITNVLFNDDSVLSKDELIKILDVQSNNLYVGVNHNFETYRLTEVEIDGSICNSSTIILNLGLNLIDVSSCSLLSTYDVNTTLLTINDDLYLKSFR